MTMILIGHVDSGKSTLLGHFLTLRYQSLDDNTRQRLDHRRSSLAFWHYNNPYIQMIDHLKTELEWGLTINTSFWRFASQNYNYTAINSPGHRDFIRNMITGSSQADIALLVIDCSLGGFECSWSSEGQIREHILIAMNLGIHQVIVGLNKMDACAYSEIRFDEIKQEISDYLKKLEFPEAGITFLPISGLEGDNLVERSNRLRWYTGPTLFEALDAVKPPARYEDKPLRIPILRSYWIGGVGVVNVGRVASGVLRSGMAITFSPSGKSVEVGSIEVHHESVSHVSQGEIVGFRTSENFPLVKRGEVGSDPFNSPALVCESFQAQVVIISHPGQIKCGYRPIMSCHTAHIPTTLTSIDEQVGSNHLLGTTLDYMVEGNTYVATFEPSKPMVIEPFSEYPALGRFLLRDIRQIVAVGIVKSVRYQYSNLGKGARR
jgi:elongation factor 1-alpha